MRIEPYRRVLALRGVRSLTSVAILVRMPHTAGAVVLTLFVVLGLGHGYAAAGAVVAAATVGEAIGATWLGRMVDRRGLRPVLILTICAEAVFWTGAIALPYGALLVAALAGGFLAFPVFVVRQALAALVPESQRRTAYAMDSMSVELSYLTGPALGVLVVTALSPTAGMLAVGAATVIGGLALLALNPPVRSGHAGQQTSAPAARWLTTPLLAVLGATFGAAVILSGTELALIAALRQHDELRWVSVVLASWAVMSILGGFVHGSVPRSLPPVALTALMGLLTVPVGLAGTWWMLCLALLPAGVLVAATVASTSDAVSRLAPEPVRGAAMGLHGASITAGFGLGAPLTGAAMDASSPAWGFVVAGGVGFVVACAAAVVARGRPSVTATDQEARVSAIS